MSEPAYPLSWPLGWARSKWRLRSRFDAPSVAKARGALSHQLDLLGAQHCTLSTNVELRLDGQPRSDRRPPEDPGAAVYFTLKGQRRVLACDKWDFVADNIWAIAKTIEAQRGIERWGCVTAEQAFSGYARLEHRTTADCWEVLGIPAGSSEEQILDAYRKRAKNGSHPDSGGSAEDFDRLCKAKDVAIATIKSR